MPKLAFSGSRRDPKRCNRASKPMRVVGLCLVASLVAFPMLAKAAPSHGLSTFGDLKYPADFTKFDYVNPAAPKGGRMTMFGGFTYDSFNREKSRTLAACPVART